MDEGKFTDQQRQDATTIRDKIDKFNKYYNAHNMYAVSGLFTRDCRLMHPGTPTDYGRDSVAAGHRRAHEFYGIITFKCTIDQFHFLYDDVSVITFLNSNYDHDDKVINKTKGVMVWKKVNDDWKIHIDIYNECCD